MKVYELTFILNPNLDDRSVEAEVDKLVQQLKAHGGNVVEIQRLGVRRMQYQVKKHNQGNYITIYYQSNPSVPKQLETGMKLNESVLRFLTVVLSSKEYKPVERPQEEEKAPLPEDV